MRTLIFAACLVMAPNAANADAQSRQDAADVPVFEGGIARPYVIVGEINDNLRKPFAFMADPTKEKIYAEIWERARKMGANAVINARYGATKVTLFNNGRTPISGTAIKYTDDVEQNK